jgi:Glycosyl transferase family 90
LYSNSFLTFRFVDGGTSWAGTLSKLSMPGLLFHHETMTKDWFFDLMQPWIHYIPVQTDLSDLRVKFQWAEDNEDKAKAIALESKALGERIMSVNYFEHVYEELYIDYLGKVVQAYNPNDMSWEDCLKKYDEAEIRLFPISDISLRSKPSWLSTYNQLGIQSMYFGLPGKSFFLL